MTISIVEFDRREEWNASVAGSPFGHLFQSWEWGELQDGLGGRPRRLAAMVDGRIAGCVQMLVFQGETRTFAYVPRGPVADPADEPLVAALVQAMQRVCAAEGARLLRVEPQWTSDADLARRLQGFGFAPATQFIMPWRTLLVDLDRAPDAIWNGFHSTTRNRIRVAEKRGVEVRIGGDADVAAFIRLNDEAKARRGLRPDRPEMYQLASAIFGARDTMRLYLARERGGGEDLAGIMVFVLGENATYLWGASSSSEASRHLNPNQLLHWTAMQWARERGCRTYDLFGVPDADEAQLEAEYGQRSDGWWNLYRFKRGFGGRLHRHLGTYDSRFADP